MAPSLAHCTALTHLDLSDNAIGPKGAGRISLVCAYDPAMPCPVLTQDLPTLLLRHAQYYHDLCSLICFVGCGHRGCFLHAMPKARY